MNPEVTTPPRKKSVLKRVIGLGLTILVLAALAYPKLRTSTEANAAPGATRGRDTLAATAYVVKHGVLTDRIYTTGTVRANESVDLVAEASGKLVGIFFNEGASVQKGQLLVKINDADLQAQRNRAEYRLRLATEREERQRQILEKGGISREQYDETVNEVNVLKAEVQLIDAQIAKTEIRAPFSGVVGLRNVSEGAYVSPQTRIATLQSLNPIKVDFAVPERYTGQLKPGDAIQFKVQGTNRTIQGRVYAVEPLIAENTRSLQLRAQTANPGNALLPGALADVEVILGRMEEALAVPAISVVPQLGGARVYVFRNGQAEARPVQTGIRTDSTVQVVGGLAVGDTVLTSGLQQIRPGIPVKVAIRNEQ